MLGERGVLKMGEGHTGIAISLTPPRLTLKEERQILVHGFKETSVFGCRVQREESEVRSSVPGIVSTSHRRPSSWPLAMVDQEAEHTRPEVGAELQPSKALPPWPVLPCRGPFPKGSTASREQSH